MAKKTKEEKNKMNPILWFLVAIVIPLVVAITITVIVLTITGVDVGGWVKKTGKNIPVVSSLIQTDEEKGKEQSEAHLQKTLTEKDAEIALLKTDVTDLKDNVDQLEQEILKAENAKTSEKNLATKKPEDQETVDVVKKLSASFKTMDPAQAALIFEKLDKDIAVSLLKNISNDIKGQIFEAMDPAKAAEFMKLYIKSEEEISM